MSLIPNKKCHICNSTFPDKVIFCSVCGTELVEEGRQQPSSAIESPLDLPSGHPNSKTFFRDEPLETKLIDKEFVTDKTQYAWRVSDNFVPFRMKNQVSYCDTFKSPKIELSKFKQLSVLDWLVHLSLNLVIAISLVLVSSIILLTTLHVIPSNWLAIFLAVSSSILYLGFSYIGNFNTAKKIANWDDYNLESSKRLIPYFLFTFCEV